LGLDKNCGGDFGYHHYGEYYGHYDGRKPLYYYSHDLSNIKYFGAGTFSPSLDEYQKRIASYMRENSAGNFILLGHSLGADAILGATHLVRDDNISIKGVMLLDAGAGINQGNNQAYINDLIRNNVPVASFYSQQYLGYANDGTVTLPSDSVLASDATDHFNMAVNPSVFLQSGPIFYSWILTLGQ
jgi:pimeloyl-ACP methyl ester carboxylesterase